MIKRRTALGAIAVLCISVIVSFSVGYVVSPQDESLTHYKHMRDIPFDPDHRMAGLVVFKEEFGTRNEGPSGTGVQVIGCPSGPVEGPVIFGLYDDGMNAAVSVGEYILLEYDRVETAPGEVTWSLVSWAKQES